MTSRRTSPTAARLAVLSLACAAALGLGACGGDDDDDGAAAETTPTDAAATTTEVPTDQGNNPRAQVEELLSTLLAQQGLSDEQIDCVVDELRQSVTDAEIADAIANSRLSRDVSDAATEAALSCTDAGG